MKDFILQEVLFDFEEIDSTNQKAKEMLENSPMQCFVVSAKRQTAGRGRMGRKWESSFEGNIYMTIAFNENLAGNMGEVMPLYASFCVMDAIGEEALYKWPNDVIIQGKKVAGILTQKVNGFFIVGIGVNVAFSPLDTLFPAGNLKEFSLSVTKEKIFEVFKNKLELRVDFILNALSKKFFTANEIKVNHGEFTGFFAGITQSGNLLLKTANGGAKEVSFGDVGVL